MPAWIHLYGEGEHPPPSAQPHPLISDTASTCSPYTIKLHLPDLKPDWYLQPSLHLWPSKSTRLLSPTMSRTCPVLTPVCLWPGGTVLVPSPSQGLDSRPALT